MTTQNKIDIVYLWVDGNDPKWRAKRKRAAQALSASSLTSMAVFSNVEGRFRDNDELRYSLRALEKYFPDHGHVYIVTDGQTPVWLRATGGLTIIDHRELIPADALPTFDSGNIESYIHHIPGLSERYFYFNDDVFFGAPVDVDDWFWTGGIFTAWSDDAPVLGEALLLEATSLENGCRLSRQWLADHADESGRLSTYQHTPRTFAHAPRPMLKSLLLQLESCAPDMFAAVRSTRFRAWDKPSIVSDFVLRWALAQGVARLKTYPHGYVSTGDARTGEQLLGLEARFGELDFFCINDTTDNAHLHDPRLVQVRLSLQRMLGDPSKFEQNATPERVGLRRGAKTELVAAAEVSVELA